MQESKKFTAQELSVLEDQTFFEVKAGADRKVLDMLSGIKNELEELYPPPKHILPKGLDFTPGRISRGENHHGFPYRLLDCPRSSSGGDLFLFRVLFLWGHHFSIHLILSGRYLRHLYPLILSSEKELKAIGYLKSIQESPWDWFLNEDTHTDSFDLPPELPGGDVFLKLSKKIPLRAYEHVHSSTVECWKDSMQLLTP